MELEHNEVKQLINSSKQLDNRIVEGIDNLKPKLAQVKAVAAVAVAAVAVAAVATEPAKSVLTKRKTTDWTAEESDDEEPAATDNSAW